MSRNFFKMQLPVMLVVGAITTGLVAWKEDQSASAKFVNADTVPKKERKIRNLDEALEELDRGQAELEKSMKNLDKELVIPTPVIPPIPPIDIEKIMVDVQKSLKAVDAEKIKTDLEQSLKSIDVEAMKTSVAEAIKEIDAQKINAEVQASLAKIDMEKMKKDMEALKMEMPKIQEELKNLKPQIEESMRKAKADIEKAKVEIREYKEFESGLERDGLINKENYFIEHKDGKLYIDGKLQPESVYKKYQSFLQKHKDFKLKKDDDNINLEKN